VESLRVVKDEPCPKCGKALLKKKGKFGNFWGCEGYPDCNHMEPVRRGRKKQGEEEGGEAQD
jgi:ssDNA-binding Zn-finger/Zn-ribbon topoisomerase 1